MKYFIDTEFSEGFHKPLFGRERHFIDLISIGIVSEDGREFYRICNEFDLDYVWHNKDTWVKNNVLKPLHTYMCQKESTYAKTYHYELFSDFNKTSMGNLLKWQGKSRKEIANNIYQFICPYSKASEYAGVGGIDEGAAGYLSTNPPEFYGYYCDYDWVLFCSLFGRMMDLPKGFPMYAIDLKQSFDEKANSLSSMELTKLAYPSCTHDVYIHVNNPKMPVTKIGALKDAKNYPKQENEHNSLADAKWNKSLYDFLKTI